MLYVVLISLFANIVILAWLIWSILQFAKEIQDQNRNLQGEAAWKLVIMAQEAMANLKAGSLEQKVATDIRIRQSQVEIEQLKQALRSGQPPANTVPSSDTIRRVLANTPDGVREVDLAEYDILT